MHLFSILDISLLVIFSPCLLYLLYFIYKKRSTFPYSNLYPFYIIFTIVGILLNQILSFIGKLNYSIIQYNKDNINSSYGLTILCSSLNVILVDSMILFPIFLRLYYLGISVKNNYYHLTCKFYNIRNNNDNNGGIGGIGRIGRNSVVNNNNATTAANMNIYSSINSNSNNKFYNNSNSTKPHKLLLKSMLIFFCFNIILYSFKIFRCSLYFIFSIYYNRNTTHNTTNHNNPNHNTTYPIFYIANECSNYTNYDNLLLIIRILVSTYHIFLTSIFFYLYTKIFRFPVNTDKLHIKKEFILFFGIWLFFNNFLNGIIEIFCIEIIDYSFNYYISYVKNWMLFSVLAFLTYKRKAINYNVITDIIYNYELFMSSPICFNSFRDYVYNGDITKDKLYMKFYMNMKIYRREVEVIYNTIYYNNSSNFSNNILINKDYNSNSNDLMFDTSAVYNNSYNNFSMNSNPNKYTNIVGSHSSNKTEEKKDMNINKIDLVENNYSDNLLGIGSDYKAEPENNSNSNNKEVVVVGKNKSIKIIVDKNTSINLKRNTNFNKANNNTNASNNKIQSNLDKPLKYLIYKIQILYKEYFNANSTNTNTNTNNIIDFPDEILHKTHEIYSNIIANKDSNKDSNNNNNNNPNNNPTSLFILEIFNEANNFINLKLYEIYLNFCRNEKEFTQLENILKYADFFEVTPIKLDSFYKDR